MGMGCQLIFAQEEGNMSICNGRESVHQTLRFSLQAAFLDIILESESKSFIQAVEQKERDLSALVKLLMKLSTFLISLGHGD